MLGPGASDLLDGRRGSTTRLDGDRGVEYRAAGPWSSSGGGQRGQTAVAWQQGFEIMVISENVRHSSSGETTHVAELPTIPLETLVEVATSDIWFEDPT